MSEENILEVEPKNDHEPAFRQGLELPQVKFGRCSITGEWGKVVNINLGEICIEGPNVDEGVEYDPLTKKVTFTQFKPHKIATLLSVSEAGLELLLTHSRNHDNPVPGITPVSVYQWQVLNTDGSVQTQFFLDAEGNTQEQHSGVIVWPNVLQLSVIPKNVQDTRLPTYTFNFDNGKFFKAGVELDVEYDHPVDLEGMDGFYARHNTISFGSIVEESMNRSLAPIHTTVLQLIGWQHPPTGNKCIIAVDEHGNWRPWQYNPE